jgi:cytidylate kinase
MNPIHISITGDLGSGKSTVAKALCEIFKYQYLSTGGIQRQLAAEKGMNTLEFNKYTDENLSIDDYIDQRLKELNTANEAYVLDSRLAWHFVKNSYKIYLTAVNEVAAARVLIDDKRVGEPEAIDVDAKMKEQLERRTLENNRFEKNYGIKPNLFEDFDAVIDTSSASVEQLCTLIIDSYKAYCQQATAPAHWLSPKRLTPTPVMINKEDAIFFQDTPEVVCLHLDNDFYIVNEQDKVSEALQQNVPFIQTIVIAPTDNIESTQTLQEKIKNSLTKKYLQDWEQQHNMKLFTYAKLAK